MAIQYSGGTIVNTSFTPAGANPSGDYGDKVITALVNAGWGRTRIGATDVLTASANFANNETVTIDSTASKVYTFKTSIGAPANEVLIGATLADSLANLKNAINAGPGSGTAYSAATSAHTTVTATNTSTTLTVTKITGGISSDDGTNSETCANASWSGNNFTGGEDRLLSAKTSQGLRMMVKFTLVGAQFYDPGVKLSVKIADRDNVRVSTSINNTGSAISSVQTFRCIANKFSAVVFAVGGNSSSTQGFWLMFGVPYLHPFHAPFIISAATNATPIQITTTTNHDLITGQQVTIVGAEGNTAANGTFTVTKIDATNFTLDGSVGNGSYTANSAVCANVTTESRIWEAFYGHGTTAGGGLIMRSNKSAQTSSEWTSVNGFLRQGTGGANTANTQFIMPVNSGGLAGDLPWYNTQYVVTEPVLGWGTVASATNKIIGQLFNCALVRRSVTIEHVTTFDSHDWMVIGTGDNGSFASTFGYSLLMTIT